MSQTTTSTESTQTTQDVAVTVPLPPAADLAACLPLPANAMIFTVSASLDSTYKDGDSVSFTGAVDLSQLPQLLYKKLQRTGGDYATVGVSVYTEGVDTVYQSFFWTDKTPTAGPLPQSSGKYAVASAPVVLDTADPQPTTCALGPYPWCTTTATPLVTEWEMDLGPGEIDMDAPTYDQTAIQVVGYRNTNPPGTPPVDFTASHQWAYAVNAQSTVTNVISVQAGIELSWSYKVGSTLAGSTWAVKVSLQTTYTHTTSKTNQTTTTLTDASTAKMTLAPGQTSYLVTVAEVDTDATGTIELTGTVSGSVNGQTLTGDYLAQLITAMSPGVSITAQDGTSVGYEIDGTVVANVLGATSSQVTDTPPPGVPVIWVDPPQADAP